MTQVRNIDALERGFITLSLDAGHPNPARENADEQQLVEINIALLLL